MSEKKAATVADFSAIQIPLNAAAKIIAQNMGRSWDKTIMVTLNIPKNEYHVGPTQCRINPRTVVQGDIVKVIQKLFELSDTLEIVKVDRKAEAIAFEKEAVLKKMQYLRRALHNGEFESFILDDLLTIKREDRRVELPETGRALVRLCDTPQRMKQDFLTVRAMLLQLEHA
jgi:hypothetical protein